MYLQAYLDELVDTIASLPDLMWPFFQLYLILCLYCRTEIPEEELVPILESISLGKKTEDQTPAAAATAAPKTVVVASPVTDGQLKKLHKKLDQIQSLKERQHKGDKLEVNQVSKIILKTVGGGAKMMFVTPWHVSTKAP